MKTIMENVVVLNVVATESNTALRSARIAERIWNMMNRGVIMIKHGIAAGYLIGLSACIYSACDNKIVGAMLFGLGLLTICAFKLNLFTGMIGETNLCDFTKYALVFIENAFGMIFAILIFKLCPSHISAGVLCGSLMQMGVALYKKHPWATIMCVMAFLLSDARHCIAMIYNAEPAQAEWWIAFCWAVVGNMLGAKIVAMGGVRR